MSDIYSGSVHVQIKSPCKKRFPSPLNCNLQPENLTQDTIWCYRDKQSIRALREFSNSCCRDIRVFHLQSINAFVSNSLSNTVFHLDSTNE